MALALLPSAAWAHAGDFDDTRWNVWALTPDIIIATLLAGGLYVSGIMRRGVGETGGRGLRHAAFLSGVGAVFLALASPIDHMAEHMFSMHQIQHVLLRMIAPMLIALAAPQAMLIAGLPASLRRNALAPMLGGAVLRRLFAWLAEPVTVTVLYIAALCIWQLPRYHDAALLNEAIHYSMHVSMLAAGLMFWWRIFDMRPPPAGLSYGRRLMMLWIVTLSQIGLGAYMTLKSEVLYPAYDVVGRLFDVTPLTDEAVGGFIIWMPSSMMCLGAAIIVIHMWVTQEDRADARRADAGRPDAPTTGAALIAQARPKNRALAIGVTAFAIAVFASVIFAGVLNHLNTERQHAVLAHASAAPVRALR